MFETTKQINGKSVTTQYADNGAVVNIMRSKQHGTRYAKIEGPNGLLCVPIEMLSLASGKDAWMRDIAFKCDNCSARHPASKMECLLCPTCFEAAEQENTL